jgi:hypothetical protein
MARGFEGRALQHGNGRRFFDFGSGISDWGSFWLVRKAHGAGDFFAERGRVNAGSCAKFRADGSESCRFRFGFDPVLVRFWFTLER